jgi:surface carbohydrate biosynthesis protein
MKDSKNQGKWLFIPVEVKVRELQAKILLACMAAERGFNVVLGEAHAIRDALHLLPAGVLLEKGVAPSPEDSFKRFRNLGNVVVSWCEEGLVFFDDDDYVRRKISGDELAQVERFFAWGQYHADVISSNFPSMKNRIVCSGNARLDLLRPEFREVFSAETQKLQEELSPYILVNTNFSHCNHKKGEHGYLELLRNAGKIRTKEEERCAEGWMTHKRCLFDAFIPMIRRISKAFPQQKVIVRPHPGENYETWIDLYKSDSNIDVIHDGGVIPWIMASSVVIHNGCTTGIEAVLLGHPAIAYRPVTSEVYDQYLPNSVNYQSDHEDHLIESLDLLLNKHDSEQFIENPKWSKTLERYVSGTGAASACDIILEEVSKVHNDIRPSGRRPWYPLHKLHLSSYMKLNSLANTILSGARERGEYSEQKFPYLHLTELTKEIQKMRKSSKRFDGVKPKRLEENIFLLSQS